MTSQTRPRHTVALDEMERLAKKYGHMTLAETYAALDELERLRKSKPFMVEEQNVALRAELERLRDALKACRIEAQAIVRKDAPPSVTRIYAELIVKHADAALQPQTRGEG